MIRLKWDKIGPSDLFSDSGDLSFLLYFSIQCLVGNIQGTFQKNCSATFISENRLKIISANDVSCRIEWPSGLHRILGGILYKVLYVGVTSEVQPLLLCIPFWHKRFAFMFRTSWIEITNPFTYFRNCPEKMNKWQKGDYVSFHFMEMKRIDSTIRCVCSKYFN